MIAKNVVITTDNEGNNYYVAVDRLNDFSDWCDSEPDGDEFEHGTLFEGELFVVDIIKKL
ncbi:hypothetical protein [Psychrobacter sp. 72-O-c]|uniref:hypothetical protein n=1 Tax=Psychrobacter sp. 72-O-c TaxID=2774125 RepID=UPI00191924E6|nr:hypothetical protein [Psychrobacter sp. 72-O-c]